MKGQYKKVLDPDVMPFMGPGDIDALTESKTFEVTALNQSFADVFTMPEGYSRIILVIFDPTVGVFINLKSQRAKQDILNGFNTLGAGIGFLPLGTKDLDDDVINYSMEFFSQGRIAAAVTPVPPAVVQVPANPLPFQHTLTLVYGR